MILNCLVIGLVRIVTNACLKIFFSLSKYIGFLLLGTAGPEVLQIICQNKLFQEREMKIETFPKLLQPQVDLSFSFFLIWHLGKKVAASSGKSF